tara:strand:+ start:5590 stop:5793 length:204 start_codon:yes stop_codon:yes gene_type:complete
MTDRIETKCCGTIQKCQDRTCVIGHRYVDAGKCINCGWIYDAVTTWKPVSIEEMQEAHSEGGGVSDD